MDGKDIQQKPKSDNGNVCLIAGAGLGTLGTTLAVTTSFVCPMCMIGTPVLLGIGGWQKYKYLKGKKTKS